MTSDIPKSAMILAAGLGKRMRPLTHKTPKPLLTVADRAIIDYTLDHLKEAGLENVIINIHHLGSQIVQHLKNRKDLNLIFSDETKEILETGGGVLKALSNFDDSPFFVFNGDILWLDGPTSSLNRLTRFWNNNEMDGVLLLHSTVEAYGYNGIGDFLIDPNGLLTRRPECQVSPYVFTGIQLLHPRLFKNSPQGHFSLNDLYEKSIKQGRLFGIIHDGDWFHVGNQNGLKEAKVYFRQRFPSVRHR